MEFIGDSLTCGYGVDDENPEHWFKTSTEDATKSFAYKMAQILDSDYSMFCMSGYGVVSGGTTPGLKVDAVIPNYYEAMGFCEMDVMPDQKQPDEIQWDFSLFQPDAIVINLGTNDYSYCYGDDELSQEFADGYVDFLKMIRKNNPTARFFCVIGICGDEIYPWICKAVESYTSETGDDKITTITIPKPPGCHGACSRHPTESAYSIAADSYASIVRSVMGW